MWAVFFWLWFGGEMWGNAIHLQKLFWNQGFVISRCTHIRTGSGVTWHLKKIAELTWRRPPAMAVFTEKFEQVARLNLRLHKQPHDIAWGNALGSALGICKRLALRNCIRVHLRILASQISTWNRTISTKAFLGQSVISVISDMYIETLKTIPNDPVGSWQQLNGCITFYPDINITETQFQNPKQNPGCLILKREGRRILGPINNGSQKQLATTISATNKLNFLEPEGPLKALHVNRDGFPQSSISGCWNLHVLYVCLLLVLPGRFSFFPRSGCFLTGCS